MITPRLLLAVALTCGLLLQAAPPAPPEDLPAAMQRHAAARETLQKQGAAPHAELRAWYEDALKVVKADAIRKGDQTSAAATDAERNRMDRDLTGLEKATLPKVVLAVREQYDQGRAEQAAQQKPALDALLREYLETLIGLEKRLVQKFDLEAAMAVRQERAKTARELDPPAAGTPKTAVAAASTPAPIVQVGSELRAWGRLASPAPEAITFECPNANSQGRGGRAVVLKNDPTAGRSGSTWTTDYTRTGNVSNLQLVHPFREGHVVVTLRKTGLDLETPTFWEANGWDGSNHKRIRMTTDGAALFPLQDGQKYEVESQLRANGSYTIKINGKVAANAQVSTASALVFPLAVDGLPNDWPGGSAALLVGPVVGPEKENKNACEKLTFRASAP
jgi:hypothetical protein